MRIRPALLPCARLKSLPTLFARRSPSHRARSCLRSLCEQRPDGAIDRQSATDAGSVEECGPGRASTSAMCSKLGRSWNRVSHVGRASEETRGHAGRHATPVHGRDCCPLAFKEACVRRHWSRHRTGMYFRATLTVNLRGRLPAADAGMHRPVHATHDSPGAARARHVKADVVDDVNASPIVGGKGTQRRRGDSRQRLVCIASG